MVSGEFILNDDDFRHECIVQREPLGTITKGDPRYRGGHKVLPRLAAVFARGIESEASRRVLSLGIE